MSQLRRITNFNHSISLLVYAILRLPLHSHSEKKLQTLVLVRCALASLICALLGILPSRISAQDGGALSGERHRVLVSTDIGGTDPDDFQSMVHLLVYADVLDIEGLVASCYGEGRKHDILRVIDCYKEDYIHLQTYSDKYPTASVLRALTKQGETERAPYTGVRQATEGSDWIIRCARKPDKRPLHVLVWGGLEDLAQALHDAPDILPKLRVYWVGGPNKKWSPDAYQYIVENHQNLWMIESNSTYRGWFTGGNQTGEWENQEFVARHIAGKGALGDFFVSQKDDIKMGDTPSLGRILKGNPEDPVQPGWGGRYVRAWKRPHRVFHRMTTKADQLEIFGILELAIPMGGQIPNKPEGFLVVENQQLPGYVSGDGYMRFRFSPKSAKVFQFSIKSNLSDMNGRTGDITVYLPSADIAQQQESQLPFWWTDDPSQTAAEGAHSGAKTVNRWRQDYLRDFAKRMLRCDSPLTK